MTEAGLDFAALYREYAPVLARQLGRSVADREEVADLVQETFVRAVRAADRYDHDLPPGPWLATIARRLSIDAARRRRIRLEMVQSALVGDVTGITIESPEQGCVDREQARLVMHAINQLPDRQRRVLLRRNLGFSYEELALEEDLTVPAVKSLLNRARVAARRNYEQAARDRWRSLPAAVVLGRFWRRLGAAIRTTQRSAVAGARQAGARVVPASLAPALSMTIALVVMAVAALTLGASAPDQHFGRVALTAQHRDDPSSQHSPADGISASVHVLRDGMHRAGVGIDGPSALSPFVPDAHVAVEVGRSKDGQREDLWSKVSSKVGVLGSTGDNTVTLQCDSAGASDPASAAAAPAVASTCDVVDALPQSPHAPL